MFELQRKIHPYMLGFFSSLSQLHYEDEMKLSSLIWFRLITKWSVPGFWECCCQLTRLFGARQWRCALLAFSIPTHTPPTIIYVYKPYCQVLERQIFHLQLINSALKTLCNHYAKLIMACSWISLIVRYTCTVRKHAYSNILKILPPKTENIQIKILIFFHISDKNIDCGHSLEPPQRGEIENCPANKSQITNNYKFFLLDTAGLKVSLLINMKMPTFYGLFIFISREHFMLI